MADGLHDQDKLIDENAALVDTATMVAAAAFGQALLRASFSKAAFIEAEANFAQRLAGAENFINIGNGAKTDLVSAEDAEKDEAKGIASLRAGLEAITRQQERQRELEEWSRTTSTIGGVTLDGAGWSKLAKRLREDVELRERLIEAFRKHGISETEAEARFERVAEVSEIMAIPPSQRTDDQNAVVAKAKADPTFAQDMADAAHFAGLKPEVTQRSGLNANFEQAALGVNTPHVATTPVAPRSQVTIDTSLGL